MNNKAAIMVLVFILHVIWGLYGHNDRQKINKETQAIILEYQSKLTAVETEKQKTIADFLRSVKTGGGNRDE